MECCFQNEQTLHLTTGQSDHLSSFLWFDTTKSFVMVVGPPLLFSRPLVLRLTTVQVHPYRKGVSGKEIVQMQSDSIDTVDINGI